MDQARRKALALTVAGTDRGQVRLPQVLRILVAVAVVLVGQRAQTAVQA